eukprot:CAMPEP_0182503250 /NCGR_PEP_ID=MMETSP1321-20130603/14968_1 /TAXON_ID=91990 /ORGANISM="Bolidomonas sp., Strain RCC1657" /LENGTH=101 /DNA_ID=CAMNT_0024708381 /DNA_START=109 /DNA_END=411 /DNA_ORIENTATION=-
MMLYLGASFIFLLVVFLLLINREYRNTFFSFETGGEMTRRVFFEGTNIMKADIFYRNKAFRKPIEGKVKSWVKEGWATWDEEKPEWFTDQWKASVPEDMKP